MQHRNTQTKFELETTVNGYSMHQCRRPIPSYCDPGKKSPHLVFTVTTQVTYFLTEAIPLCNNNCFFSPNAPTCPCGLNGLPSWAWQKYNRRLRLGRPWGAVTLSRWCEVIWEDVVSGGPLNLNSTNLPRPWPQRESSGKIPTVEPGIEPGTSWLVGRDSDHLTTRLYNILYTVSTQYQYNDIMYAIGYTMTSLVV